MPDQPRAWRLPVRRRRHQRRHRLDLGRGRRPADQSAHAVIPAGPGAPCRAIHTDEVTAMSESEKAAYQHVERLLRLFAFDYTESLWWRGAEGKHVNEGELRFFVACNDFFAWGTADCERIVLPD